MRNKLLQFVLIQNDPDGLKLTQYQRAKAIESVIVEFNEDAIREEVWESIEQFRLDGRKAFGI
jgi:uncharacterized protein YeaC (DUF1315 family)